MGTKHSSITCCPASSKTSILEENFFEDSYRTGALRGSNYESPIPEEFWVIEPTSFQYLHNDELSTDVEKPMDVSEEPFKNQLNYSVIHKVGGRLTRSPYKLIVKN